ncbi:conserved hypothetical protein [Cellulomonas flavigena DSM 20109]|uniref:Tat pathway signal sequence domain protein n=1 Tax=Cellulomonas flavigena (strain ATCC 482 / DSM 20109 / BCRC 11376 / JCM 18109 / NBRC 3775 / NCIMB 8073 / NRS 134) TaxID=446466 RepID=D5UFL8_CELFN|nr:hypothetical protein [Cellulomonas flavigena]ADG72977.1 conserved hypothetical protein [Cellulomonas flavigena DSM 20109]
MPENPKDRTTSAADGPQHRSGLGRRAFLALAGGTAAVVAGATSAGALDGRAWGPRPVLPHRPGRHHGGRAGSERAAVAFVRAAADAYPQLNTGPRLAQSYTDELGLFSTAFVYDNALAICALLADGRRSSVDSARVIGDGLVFAQENDPDHADGRLRQGYNVGPYTFYDGSPQPDGFVRADGYANIGRQFGFLGTAVGDMAWPGLALLQLFRVTRDRTYLRAAVAIGEWITSTTWSTAPLGGFSFGVDGGNQPVPNGSTEHNVDCVAFFSMLRKATGDRRWTAASEHALAFVDRMWDSGNGWFWTGTNDGVEINRDPVPLDPATWSRLAIREKRYDRALDWAGEALAVTDEPTAPTSQLPDDAQQVSGVTFSTASLTSTAQYNGLTVHPQGVWLEGTAQLATSLLDRNHRGDKQRAEWLLSQVRRAQDTVGAGQHLGGAEVDGGVVAASSLIDTGFGFGYFQVQHVGATSWFLLASAGANPMRWDGLR